MNVNMLLIKNKNCYNYDGDDMKKKIIMIFSILFLLLFCYLFYLNYLGKSSNNITTYAKQLNIDEKTDKLLAVKYLNSINILGIISEIFPLTINGLVSIPKKFSFSISTSKIV